jgi:hypothetical protein
MERSSGSSIPRPTTARNNAPEMTSKVIMMGYP